MNKTVGGKGRRTVGTFRPRKGGKGGGGGGEREEEEKEKTRLGRFLCLDLKVGALETPAVKSTLATKGAIEPTFHGRVQEKSSLGLPSAWRANTWVQKWSYILPAHIHSAILSLFADSPARPMVNSRLGSQKRRLNFSICHFHRFHFKPLTARWQRAKTKEAMKLYKRTDRKPGFNIQPGSFVNHHKVSVICVYQMLLMIFSIKEGDTRGLNKRFSTESVQWRLWNAADTCRLWLPWLFDS